jgi:hypothetical protein
MRSSIGFLLRLDPKHPPRATSQIILSGEGLAKTIHYSPGATASTGRPYALLEI